MKCNQCNIRPVVRWNKRCLSCISKAYEARAKIEGSKAWFNKKRKILKRGAAKRSIPFNLSCADLRQMFEKVTGNCPYCEKPMSENDLATKPTVERIDNEQGYTIGNCIVICWSCNKAKGNLTKTQIRNIYCYLFG